MRQSSSKVLRMKASHAVLWGSMLVLERVGFWCQASALARACRGRMREESVNSQPLVARSQDISRPQEENEKGSRNEANPQGPSI